MTSPQTGDRSFQGQLVRVSEFTVTTTQIDGYTFVNCKIVGPAVLALLGDIEIQHCTFEGDLNSLFWEIDPAVRPQVFGAVGVHNCRFVSCQFEAIGFAGTFELRQAMAPGIR